MISPLVSFIIPVYNAEKYLEDALSSILEQDLDEGSYEVILVNDGSQDNSPAICSEWCKRSYFHLIDQTNRGVGRARNAGLEKASGSYVLFLDSDDLLIPHSISLLVNLLEEQYDMLLAGRITVKKGEIPVLASASDLKVVFKGDGIDYLLNFNHPVFCTDCLFRRDFLINNNLFFSTHGVSEDRLFMFNALSANPRLVKVNHPIYYYVIHDDSITHINDTVKLRSQVYDQLDVFRSITRKMADMVPGIQQNGVLSLQDNIKSFFRRLILSDIDVKEFRRINSELRMMKLLPLKGRDRISLLINTISITPPCISLSRGLFKIYNSIK